MLWVKLRPPKDRFKPYPQEPVNVTLFGNRAFADIISEGDLMPGEGGSQTHMTGVLIRRGEETKRHRGDALGR